MAPLTALPPFLLSQLQEGCAFRGEARWSLPYRVLWRWKHGDRGALLSGDVDGSQLQRRIRAVRGAAHRMKGFLRFQERTGCPGAPQFVAWYEPEHEVLESVAKHFIERMGRTSWLIATPAASAFFDGERLSIGGPVGNPLHEAGDRTEQLWKDYYRHTFNPERINTRLMDGHLPRRNWRNLPEASLIPQLVSAARSGSLRQAMSEPLPEHERQCQSPGKRPHSVLEHDIELDNCRACELWQSATYPVGGSGPVPAAIMLIGEQPDDHDDLVGEAFSGELGRFLDGLLAEAGLAREELYLTHAVKHFRHEKGMLRRCYRVPAVTQVAACRPWLVQEIGAVQPSALVAMGQTALVALEIDLPIVSDKQEPLGYEHRLGYVIPTRHPAYALRGDDLEVRRTARRHIVAALKLAKAAADRRYCAP